MKIRVTPSATKLSPLTGVNKAVTSKNHIPDPLLTYNQGERPFSLTEIAELTLQHKLEFFWRNKRDRADADARGEIDPILMNFEFQEEDYVLVMRHPHLGVQFIIGYKADVLAHRQWAMSMALSNLEHYLAVHTQPAQTLKVSIDLGQGMTLKDFNDSGMMKAIESNNFEDLTKAARSAGASLRVVPEKRRDDDEGYDDGGFAVTVH